MRDQHFSVLRVEKLEKLRGFCEVSSSARADLGKRIAALHREASGGCSARVGLRRKCVRRKETLQNIASERSELFVTVSGQLCVQLAERVIGSVCQLSVKSVGSVVPCVDALSAVLRRLVPSRRHERSG